MSKSVHAQFDPGTGMITLILDQADAQSLIDTLTFTGSSRVRQVLQGALQKGGSTDRRGNTTRQSRKEYQ